MQDTGLTYEGGIFKLRHSVSGYGRKKHSVQVEEVTQMQIFLYTSSIEIIINGGQYCLYSRVYPKQTEAITASGTGTVTVNAWAIEKI